ncbi:MAG: MarR family transcriptional regulator [Pseudomonadota bacterium]
MLPKEMICYALYSASHAIQQTYRDILDPLGLTYPQYLVMSVLWAGPERPSIKDIGIQVQLDSSTLTPLLKRLEKAGLVLRKRDTKDERQVRIELTQTGRELQEKALPIPDCIQDNIGMSTQEIMDLRNQLLRLSEHLRASA